MENVGYRAYLNLPGNIILNESEVHSSYDIVNTIRTLDVYYMISLH